MDKLKIKVYGIKVNKSQFLWIYGIFILFFVAMVAFTYLYNTIYQYQPKTFIEKLGSSPYLYIFFIVWIIVEAQFFWNRFTKAQLEIITEQKLQIEEKNEILNKNNREIQQQRDEIAFQKNQITDSIQYARRIQEAMLPLNEKLNQHFPNNFILYKPRDIVSGDFYWFKSISPSKKILAVADCTGHGVPGAFMSILGISLLNEIYSRNENLSASEILNELRIGVKTALRQTGDDPTTKDGMDISLCIIDYSNSKIEFAGANNPLYIVTKAEGGNPELISIKADRMPVGVHVQEKLSFTGNELSFKAGDMMYLTSDGYYDQFGGPKDERFKVKRFKELLVNISQKPLDEQKELLNNTIENWRLGKHEQIDDILVVGIRL